MATIPCSGPGPRSTWCSAATAPTSASAPRRIAPPSCRPPRRRPRRPRGGLDAMRGLGMAGTAGTAGISRRAFLKTGAAVGGGLVVGFFAPAGMRRFAFAQGAPAQAPALPAANAFLRIGSDESVTVLLAHSEMGQGIWTTMPMLVNEELDADWSRFRVEHAPAAPAYHHTAYHIQMTGGSTTTWSEFDRYRQVGG